MSTTAISNALPSSLLGTGGTGSSAASSAAAAGSEDRFLKLLVTQMQNQDPLNPMDNAQMTSQIAQINTVSGIDKLNTTVSSLNSQFLQMQTLQGATLVGHGVLLEGNKLVAGDGGSVGAYELSGAADTVKLEVLNAAGQVVDSQVLGAESAGRHGFTWVPPATVTDTSKLSFRITAKSGAGAVTATPLMSDTVTAVAVSGNTLTLSLQRGGDVPYSSIKAFD